MGFIAHLQTFDAKCMFVFSDHFLFTNERPSLAAISSILLGTPLFSTRYKISVLADHHWL